MKKNALSPKGLSLSQAQSISNLIFQKTREIDRQLAGINNASKKVNFGGESFDVEQGKPLPENVVDLLMEKSRLHATQAFLMENIKAKDELLKFYQRKAFALPEGVELVYPTAPMLVVPEVIPAVTEAYGWAQLSLAEVNEFLEVEAKAAHIGQFIHKGGVLDTLRSELPSIKNLEWMDIVKDQKTPVRVTVHHTPDQLLTVHNQLAAEHRVAEQRVNYFKAKVKNLVTDENARIARVNAEAQSDANAKNNHLRTEFQAQVKDHDEQRRTLEHAFEEERQRKIREVAALRIEVDERFQDVVNEFLKQTGESN
jgi:hypothetical protein